MLCTGIETWASSIRILTLKNPAESLWACVESVANLLKNARKKRDRRLAGVEGVSITFLLIRFSFNHAIKLPWDLVFCASTSKFDEIKDVANAHWPAQRVLGGFCCRRSCTIRFSPLLLILFFVDLLARWWIWHFQQRLPWTLFHLLGGHRRWTNIQILLVNGKVIAYG